MKEFAGKTAVVTGAGSGIGRALARRFAYEEMFVVAADIEAPALAETIELIERVGGRATAVVTDVANADSVQQLADAAFADHGGTHVLCNNAGVFSGGLLWQRTLRDWQWVLGVNLYGIVHADSQFCAPHARAGHRVPHRQHGVDGRAVHQRVFGPVLHIQIRRGRTHRVSSPTTSTRLGRRSASRCSCHR
jgi:NAD(P)-dependent dehydrogenase (short-subunit alcohol dehydrogenase family)